MYKIIGADQKEYGPVSGEQLRQWIRDGRVNAQTQTRSEAGGDWQPLSAFPEFADIFGAPMGAPLGGPPTPGTSPALFASGFTGSREAALSAVKGPAIALIVVAALGIAYYCFNGIYVLAGGGPAFQHISANASPAVRQFFEGARGPMAGVFSFVFAALNGFVLWGAIKMLRLQSFGLAMATCIVAMVPLCTGCCCILGLPFGIWGLVVLNKPEVKSQFPP